MTFDPFTVLETTGILGEVAGVKSLVAVILAPSGARPIAVCRLPVLPESYNEVNNYMVNVQPTLGGGFADKYGVAPGQLTLRGKFLMTRKQVVNYMMPVPVNALGALRWMRYFSDIASGGDATGPYRVVLLNWMTNRHWQIEIKQVSFSQEIGRNGVWVYAMQIELLKALPSPERDWMLRVLDEHLPAGIWGVVASTLTNFVLGWFAGTVGIGGGL